MIINSLLLLAAVAFPIPETVAVHPAPEKDVGDVKALFVESVPWKGKDTRFFAYYGLPAGASLTNKVPGIVLVHGGWGTAFHTWVKTWNARGYAAIAMDTCGGLPGTSLNCPEHPRHAWSGPNGWGCFKDEDLKPEDQWMYHAVESVIRSHTFLRNLPEVNAAKIGVTGISWGGVLTSVICGADPRFAFAAPVYGCGNLRKHSVWSSQIGARWDALWDPLQYAARCRIPTLWCTGTNDHFFPLDSFIETAQAAGNPIFSIKVRMPHGHPPTGDPPEIRAFADSVVGGSRFCATAEDVIHEEWIYTESCSTNWESRPFKTSATRPPRATFAIRNQKTKGGLTLTLVETDATLDLQARIDAAWRAGGGEVVISAGEHRLRPVRLRSGVRLRFARGAHVRGVRDCEAYVNAWTRDALEPISEMDLRKSSGEDLTRRSQYALFTAFGAHDVEIVGEEGSFISGENCPDAKGAEGYRGPHVFSFACTTNVMMRNVSVRNSGDYAFRFLNCRGVTCDGVSARGGHDGIHFDLCSHVRIFNADLRTGDDAVAASGCSDVIVSNCLINTACSPFRLGGRDVLVTDCHAWGPAEYPHRWTLSREEKLSGAAAAEGRGRRTVGCFYQGYTGDVAHRGFVPGNIVVRNTVVENAERFLLSVSGLPAALWQDGRGITDITFENVRATGLGQPSAVVAKADEPMIVTLRGCLFSFRTPQTAAIFGKNVKVVDGGVRLENASRLYEERPGVSYDDVPEFPSWQIESDEQRAKWGLPPCHADPAAPAASSRSAQECGWISVFNQDSTNFTATHEDGEMNAAGVRAYLDSVIGQGAFTHFFICPNAQTALFDTKTLSPSWWRLKERGGASNAQTDVCPRRDYMLFTNGVDVVKTYVDGCRAKGVSPWLSMRMNDSHCPNDTNWWGHSKFWIDHPEYRQKGGFNFSFPEVRDYHLAFVRELLERYDVDGIECDWMRFPLKQRPEDLTAVMRDVRKAAGLAAKRRGHPILVGVRIASRPARAAELGMDVQAWVKEGLVDWIVPCNFFASVDFELPVEAWKKLAAGGPRPVRVIPGADSGVRADDPKTGKPVGRRLLTTAEYREWADRMQKRGAEGVYLFNLFTYLEKAYKAPSLEPWHTILKEGLSPAAIAGKEKRFPEGWKYEP